MIKNKKEFGLGFVMMLAFLAILVVIFMPIFKGQNGMDYLDGMFNSISKGSANYVPKLREHVETFAGTSVDMNLKMASKEEALLTAKLMEGGGATASVTSDNTVAVSGDLGLILQSSLQDVEAMYNNEGDVLTARYGVEPQLAMYTWWQSMKMMDKSLTKQKNFKAAKEVGTVSKKGVETAYNYYGIEAQSIKDSAFIVIASLLFYVCYTMWYGYSILFMFEGWGLKISH